jgi:hypothetical protein
MSRLNAGSSSVQSKSSDPLPLTTDPAESVYRFADKVLTTIGGTALFAGGFFLRHHLVDSEQTMETFMKAARQTLSDVGWPVLYMSGATVLAASVIGVALDRWNAKDRARSRRESVSGYEDAENPSDEDEEPEVVDGDHQ